MRALRYHGKGDVRCDTVPDPKIEHPRDAIIKITSTGLCGSDLHLYSKLGLFMEEGDILVDGGNAHFLDTRRREAALREKGIHFAGVGVSVNNESAAD